MINIFDAEALARAKQACQEQLRLVFEGICFRLHADNPDILAYLRHYYAGLTCPEGLQTKPSDWPERSIFLLDQPADIQNANWTPVQRKKASPLGLKEAYVDTPDGRWIHKVRTGMVMFQSLADLVVIGELQANHSQVVNFINNQFLNHYQQQGYLLGHAAAFTANGEATAIAASSGGGKSTLMLKALEAAGARFLSNDRILFRPDGKDTRVLGVAKHPRVNPGTLLHSERLMSILPEPEQHRLANLPVQALWDLEQKYDVPIPDYYGAGKVELSGTLKHLVLLDWSLGSPAETALQALPVDAITEALDGLRKSPGPFFQDASGHFPPEKARSRETYASHLSGMTVWRITGRVDFDHAVELLKTRGLL